MTNLFIPPPGAMQFELEPKYAERAKSQVIWVFPAREGYVRSCGCRIVYPIATPHPQRSRAAEFYGVTEDKEFVVCKHIGKIIE